MAPAHAETKLARFSEDEVVEAFNFLDALRESGATNMFGAAPYVMEALEHSRADAIALVSAWMTTFGYGSPAAVRAATAKAEAV